MHRTLNLPAHKTGGLSENQNIQDGCVEAIPSRSQKTFSVNRDFETEWVAFRGSG
jgi:hypothetical protein